MSYEATNDTEPVVKLTPSLDSIDQIDMDVNSVGSVGIPPLVAKRISPRDRMPMHIFVLTATAGVLAKDIERNAPVGLRGLHLQQVKDAEKELDEIKVGARWFEGEPPAEVAIANARHVLAMVQHPVKLAVLCFGDGAIGVDATTDDHDDRVVSVLCESDGSAACVAYMGKSFGRMWTPSVESDPKLSAFLSAALKDMVTRRD